MTTGYLLILYWMVVAIGGALFLGTGAALLRYRRTGAFPGPEGATAGHAPSRRETTRVVVRCALGLLLAAGGATGLLATY
jgi:hypothetical protein